MVCKVRPEWLKMESEHTKSKSQQRKIVCDHVKEFGSGYYPALKKMELKLGRKK